MTIRRVLVANRGEIALRIIRACQGLGLEAVAAVSEADRDALPARLANQVVCIGPAQPALSYLNVGALIEAARGAGCDALHPGYGFLSERPELAEACAANGITFVGPPVEAIRGMGDKLAARALAQRLGVPIVPGSLRVTDPNQAARLAAEVGYPVLLKAAGGGGGRGIKIAADPATLRGVIETASAEARAAFGDATVYLERYIPNARHVEVQVLGDRYGNVAQLGERDCSLQRRYQKLVEESPSLAVPPAVRSEMEAAALRLTRELGYHSAGTIEFLFDAGTDRFYFLEMNTRIQVEHPVTEMVTGLDLVQLQLRVAAGEPLPFSQGGVSASGHAIECRVTAESPWEGFRPSPGVITVWRSPGGPHVRVDTHCHQGYAVPPFYDSLLAKLIVWGETRPAALSRLTDALDRFVIQGIDTTLPFLRQLVRHPEFRAGSFNTRWVEERFVPSARQDRTSSGTSLAS